MDWRIEQSSFNAGARKRNGMGGGLSATKMQRRQCRQLRRQSIVCGECSRAPVQHLTYLLKALLTKVPVPPYHVPYQAPSQPHPLDTPPGRAGGHTLIQALARRRQAAAGGGPRSAWAMATQGCLRE